MKKLFLYVMILALAVSSLCATAVDEMPKVYLAIGDSISTGYGLEDTAFGFSERLSEKVGLELANRAVNGAKADDVYERLSSGELDELVASAELITLTVGGNDMLDVLYKEVADSYNKYYEPKITAGDVSNILADSADNRRITLALRAFSILSGSAEKSSLAESDIYAEALTKYEKNLSDIADYIEKINDDVRIVVATQYNPYKTFENTDFSNVYTSVDECISKLNRVILAVAEEKDFTVADVYTAFRDSEENLCNSDADLMNLDFHPNLAGHGVIAECIAEVVPVKKTTFQDVASDDWFYDAVEYVYASGLLNGVGEGRFAPHMPVTRGMMVTILHRAEGSPQVSGGGKTFADVNADSYYAEAIDWARDNDIVKGYSDTEFAPDASITREQLAAIILRYCTYKGSGPVGAWAIRLDYSDLGDISDFAVEGVMYCTMKGYMSGRDDGTFAPKALTTRAEAAAIIHRVMQD